MRSPTKYWIATTLSVLLLLACWGLAGTSRAQQRSHPVDCHNRDLLATIGLDLAMWSVDEGPRTATLVFEDSAYLSMTFDGRGRVTAWESSGLTDEQELDVILTSERLGKTPTGGARFADGAGVMRDVEAFAAVDVIGLADIEIDDGLVDIQVVVDPHAPLLDMTSIFSDLEKQDDPAEKPEGDKDDPDPEPGPDPELGDPPGDDPEPEEDDDADNIAPWTEGPMLVEREDGLFAVLSVEQIVQVVGQFQTFQH